LRASDTSGGVNDLSSCSSNDDNYDDEVEEDPEGIGDKGFANFTRSLVVIYLHQWLNKKPGQTDFCSQQMPVEAQSDSLAVGLTATASDSGSSTKKWKRSKINNKDVLMDIVTEIK